MENTHTNTGRLGTRLFVSILVGIGLLMAIFFLPAGTWAYWQAWVYMLLLAIPGFIGSFLLVRKDPALVQRRMTRGESRTEQKKIQYLSYPFYILAFLLPGFDRRFGWSHTPWVVVAAADALFLLGILLIFWVMNENSYASRTIGVEAGQKVISSGPYAHVRHPMYLGLILMFVFSPLALGSWVAVISALFIIPFVVARMLDEEKVLIKELNGYQDYLQRVKYRLIPGLW